MLNDEDVRDYFKRTAVTFDDLYGPDKQAKTLFDTIFRKPIYWRFELTLDALREATGKKYLDVGCGSGRHATALAELGARVTGVDFSEEMLDLAAQYASSKGLSDRTEFITAHFMDWASETKANFDAAYALGVFDYTTKPAELLSAMAEKADTVITSWPSPAFPRSQLRTWRYKRMGCPVYYYKQADVERVHKEAGLKIDRLVKLGGAGFWTKASRAG